MSERRRAVPKVDRHVSPSKALDTFFEMMVPPGVSERDSHAYLTAHLGEPIAEEVERNFHWDVGTGRVWQ